MRKRKILPPAPATPSARTQAETVLKRLREGAAAPCAPADVIEAAELGELLYGAAEAKARCVKDYGEVFAELDRAERAALAAVKMLNAAGRDAEAEDLREVVIGHLERERRVFERKLADHAEHWWRALVAMLIELERRTARRIGALRLIET